MKRNNILITVFAAFMGLIIVNNVRAGEEFSFEELAASLSMMSDFDDSNLKSMGGKVVDTSDRRYLEVSGQNHVASPPPPEYSENRNFISEDRRFSESEVIQKLGPLLKNSSGRFECRFCHDKDYTTKPNCKNHEKICSENKNRIITRFQCEFCHDKDYSTKFNCKNHEKICSENKNRIFTKFKCNFCPKDFKRKDNCKRHEEGCSENKNRIFTRFKCKFCPKDYSTKPICKRHEKTCKCKGRKRKKSDEEIAEEEIDTFSIAPPRKKRKIE